MCVAKESDNCGCSGEESEDVRPSASSREAVLRPASPAAVLGVGDRPPTLLSQLADGLVGRLPGQCISRIGQAFGAPAYPVQLGTMCSGTDIVVSAFKALMRAAAGCSGGQVAEEDASDGGPGAGATSPGGPGPSAESALGAVDVCVEHVLACESDVSKRAFILERSRPRILYDDIVSLGRDGEGMNTLTGRIEKLPPLDMLVVGFSCKDFSSLSNKWTGDDAAQKRRIIAKGLGTSGSTFAGLVDVLRGQ